MHTLFACGLRNCARNSRSESREKPTRTSRLPTRTVAPPAAAVTFRLAEGVRPADARRASTSSISTSFLASLVSSADSGNCARSIIPATSRWRKTARAVYLETILRRVFEAEAKAASATPAKVVYTVAVPITKVYTSDTSVTFVARFILVELCGTEVGQ
eukprot:scaffold18217_cov58-Phaeocystis_antarctica.AAC.2